MAQGREIQFELKSTFPEVRQFWCIGIEMMKGKARRIWRHLPSLNVMLRYLNTLKEPF